MSTRIYTPGVGSLTLTMRLQDVDTNYWVLQADGSTEAYNSDNDADYEHSDSTPGPAWQYVFTVSDDLTTGTYRWFVFDDSDNLWSAGIAKWDGTDWHNVASDVAETLATVGTTGVAVADKTGYALAADGLDTVATTAPSGVASNFREMIVQTWRWFYKRSAKDSTAKTLKTYADDGTTVVTTATIEETPTTETKGAAS